MFPSPPFTVQLTLAATVAPTVAKADAERVRHHAHDRDERLSLFAPGGGFEHRRRLRNRGAVVPRLRAAEVDAAGAAHHRLAVAERAAPRLHDAQLDARAP